MACASQGGTPSPALGVSATCAGAMRPTGAACVALLVDLGRKHVGVVDVVGRRSALREGCVCSPLWQTRRLRCVGSRPCFSFGGGLSAPRGGGGADVRQRHARAHGVFLGGCGTPGLLRRGPLHGAQRGSVHAPPRVCAVTSRGPTRRVLASSTTTGEGRGGMRRGSDGDGRPVRSASHDSEGRWCHCSAVGSRAAVRHSAGLQPTGTPPPSRRVSVLRFARRGDGAESSEPCAPGCEILSRTYSWPCRRGGRDVRRHRASPEFTRRLSRRSPQGAGLSSGTSGRSTAHGRGGWAQHCRRWACAAPRALREASTALSRAAVAAGVGRSDDGRPTQRPSWIKGWWRHCGNDFGVCAVLRSPWGSGLGRLTAGLGSRNSAHDHAGRHHSPQLASRGNFAGCI